MASTTGSWWGLHAVFEHQRREFDQWRDIVQGDGGLACPVCGEPLRPSGTGPSDVNSSVDRYCRFGGDHEFHVPRDVVSPQHGVKMGRFG